MKYSEIVMILTWCNTCFISLRGLFELPSNSRGTPSPRGISRQADENVATTDQKKFLLFKIAISKTDVTHVG